MTFDDWLKENSAVLYDDFSEVTNLKKLRDWLEIAYEAGHDDGFLGTLDFSKYDKHYEI